MGERFTARVIADGRVTIPSHVREELDVDYGDYLILDAEGVTDE